MFNFLFQPSSHTSSSGFHTVVRVSFSRIIILTRFVKIQDKLNIIRDPGTRANNVIGYFKSGFYFYNKKENKDR